MQVFVELIKSEYFQYLHQNESNQTQLNIV